MIMRNEGGGGEEKRMHALFSQDPDWGEKEFKYKLRLFFSASFYIFGSLLLSFGDGRLGWAERLFGGEYCCARAANTQKPHGKRKKKVWLTGEEEYTD